MWFLRICRTCCIQSSPLSFYNSCTHIHRYCTYSGTHTVTFSALKKYGKVYTMPLSPGCILYRLCWRSSAWTSKSLSGLAYIVSLACWHTIKEILNILYQENPCRNHRKSTPGGACSQTPLRKCIGVPIHWPIGVVFWWAWCILGVA